MLVAFFFLLNTIYLLLIAHFTCDEHINSLFLFSFFHSTPQQIPKATKGGNKHEVIVQLVKRDRVVVTVPAMGNAVAVQSVRVEGAAPGTAEAVTAADEVFKTYHVAQHWSAVLARESGVLTAELTERVAAFEGAVADIADVREGQLVRAKVLSKTPVWLNVALGPRVRGRVHLSDVWDWDRVGTGHPFEGIAVGQELDAAVLGVGTRDLSSSLAITGSKGVDDTGITAARVVELTLRPSQVAPGTSGSNSESVRKYPQKVTDLHVGQVVVGYVQQVTPDGLWFSVARYVRGRMFVLEASDDVETLRRFAELYRVGQALRLAITSVDAERNHVNGSAKLCAGAPADATDVDVPADRFPEGRVVPGRVCKLVPGRGALVEIAQHMYGHVILPNFDDRFRADPLEGLKVHDILNCAVIGSRVGSEKDDKDEDKKEGEKEDKKEEKDQKEGEKPKEDFHRDIELSLRKSRLGKKLHAQNHRPKTPVDPVTGRKPAKDPELRTAADLKPDMLVHGYVRARTDDGVFVTLGTTVRGFVKRSMLSESFVPNGEQIKQHYPIGTLVYGKVLRVDVERNSAFIATRDSIVHADKWLTLEKLKTGAKVNGHVQTVAKYGVFVDIDYSRLHGLCIPRSMNTGGVKVPFAKLLAFFKKGMPVVVTIAKIDAKKKTIDLAMDLDPSTVERINEIQLDEENKDANTATADSTTTDADEKEAKEAEIAAKKPCKEDTAPLNVDAAFDWESVEPKNDESMDEPDEDMGDEEENEEDDEMDDDDDEEEEDENEDEDEEEDEDEDEDEEEEDEESEEESEEEKEKETKKRRKTYEERRAEKRKREETVEKMEDDLAKGKAPETAPEFERFVANNPSSSFAWIKYMAFELSQNDVVAARNVAERAIQKLQTFVKGPEGEREVLNVWVALLNLENNFGTSKTFKEVLDRALQSNDDIQVLEQTAKLLEASGKLKEADTMFQRLLKKRKGSVKTWAKYAEFCLRTNPKFDTRAFFERATQSVPKHKYTRLVTQLARIEFKHGSPERARTMFAGLLGLYPKRVDLWDVYLDQELRLGDIDKCRALFRQTVALKVSSKKIQHFFKRWLLFEKEFGTDQTVAAVKKKAQEYVDSKTA